MVSHYTGFHADDYVDVVAAARNRFATNIRQIVGDANVVRLIVPARADTTTTTDLSRNAATCTWDATIAARLSQQGLGYNQTFASASSHLGTMPDAADLSFGNGTADSPFSFVSLANVTNTASERPLVTKWSSGVGAIPEWQLNVEAADTLRCIIRDASASVHCTRISTGAITQGSIRLLAATYSGVGGASAGDGIILYEDAAVIASSATNNASYVAMEDGTSTVDLGSVDDSSVDFDGSILMTLICSIALSAAQLTSIKTAVNEFYGLSL